MQLTHYLNSLSTYFDILFVCIIALAVWITDPIMKFWVLANIIQVRHGDKLKEIYLWHDFKSH